MEKVLILLDSPVKVKSITKALNKLGLSFDALLFDVSKFSFLKDPYTSNEESIFTDFVSDELNEFESFVDGVNLQSSKYTFILLATDPDDFGDFVSFKIYELLTEKTKAIRCKLNSFDTNGIELAFHSSAHVPDCCSTEDYESKRIFISALTEQLHNNNCQVDFPSYSILNHIKKNVMPYAFVRINVPGDDGNGDYVGDLMVSQSNEAMVSEYLNEAKAIRSMELYAAENIPLCKPWGYVDAVVSICDRVGANHAQVSNIMREMYMSGKLSFYKSESSFIKNTSIERLEKIASSHGIKVAFSDNNLGCFDHDILKSHASGGSFYEALSIVDSDIDITSPLKIMKLEDIIASMITRNLIMSAIPCRIEYPYLGDLPDWMSSINFRRVNRIKLPWIEAEQFEYYTLNMKSKFSILLELYKQLDLFKWDPDGIENIENILSLEVVSKRMSLNYKGMSLMSKSPPFATKDNILAMAEGLLLSSNENQPYKRADGVLKQIIG